MGIGIIKESSLHAAIKEWVTEPGDKIEHEVGGYIVDILRGDRILEVQTGSFSNLRAKLGALIKDYEVTVIYPIPIQRLIMRIDNKTGEQLSLRKSPKKGKIEEVFKELVYIIPFVRTGRITIETLHVYDRVEYINDGMGSWRRGRWSIMDRKLLDVVAKNSYNQPADFIELLPQNIPDPFSTGDLAAKSSLPISLSRKMVYCLYHLGVLNRVGKMGNSWLYSRSETAFNPE